MRPFDKPALSVEQQLEWLKHEACTSICPLMVKLVKVEIASTRHRFVTHSSPRKTLAVQPLNEGQKTAKSCLSPLPTCAATIGGRSLNLSLCQLSLG